MDLSLDEIFDTKYSLYLWCSVIFTITMNATVGTVGFIGTNYFVRKIYSTVKIDQTAPNLLTYQIIFIIEA